MAKNRKLTPAQQDILTRLEAAGFEYTLVHSIHSQDARTLNSLKRRYGYGFYVERVTKLPGAKYSYGYRAFRIAAHNLIIRDFIAQDLNDAGRAVV